VQPLSKLALRSEFFAIFPAKIALFWSCKLCNEKWYYFGKAQHPLCSLENYHARSENFLNKIAKISPNKWRNRPV
jgi:hypothetical protein